MLQLRNKEDTMRGISAKPWQSYIADDKILTAMQRVLEGRTFSHTVMLRQALEFVVRTSLASPGEPIKEYSIATEVFGRESDFDPKTDNIVRVQMHRLREKLDEFYSREGQGEQIRIIIPRGHYNPEYVRSSSHTHSQTTGLPQAAASSAVKSPRVNLLWFIIAALVISNALFAISFVRNRGARQAAALSPPLRALWQPFLSSDSHPLIIFSNPAFLVDKQGNLFRYRSQDVISMATGTRMPSVNNSKSLLGGSVEDGPFYFFDSYTGCGELVAASEVARFLTLHRESYTIERSRLATDEEIIRNNVIFLGGSKEDEILRKLPLSKELVFEPPPPNEYSTGSYIEDLNPSPGHPRTYHLQLDPATGAIQVEYALISLLPNLSMNHCAMDLGGLTTLGTQAAARFVTSSQDMEMLEQMRNSSAKGGTHSRFFQALLQINVRDGVPLNSKCVLVHELK